MHADDYPTVEAVDEHLDVERSNLTGYRTRERQLRQALEDCTSDCDVTARLLDRLLDIRSEVAGRQRV